jgi:hypothetical protein
LEDKKAARNLRRAFDRHLDAWETGIDFIVCTAIVLGVSRENFLELLANAYDHFDAENEQPGKDAIDVDG